MENKDTKDFTEKVKEIEAGLDNLIKRLSSFNNEIKKIDIELDNLNRNLLKKCESSSPGSPKKIEFE